jgi:hypothetical protein
MNERLVEGLDRGGRASPRAATTCHNSRRNFIRDYNGPRLR